MSGKLSDDSAVHLGSAGLLVLGGAWLAWTFDHTLAAIIAAIIGVACLIGVFFVVFK